MIELIIDLPDGSCERWSIRTVGDIAQMFACKRRIKKFSRSVKKKRSR